MSHYVRSSVVALLLVAVQSQAQTLQGDLRVYWGVELMKDQQAKGLTCQEIKVLEQKAQICPFPTVRTSYAKLVKHLRTVEFERLKVESVRHEYAKPIYYEQGDQPDGTHSGGETPEAFTERMKDTNVKELSECLGEPDTAQVLVQLLDAILRQSKTLRIAEAKCRKDKKCMIHRENLNAGADICGSIAIIKNAQEGIRAERANPSGVVNLATLHEYGETIQITQVSLNEQKAEFRTTYKRAFPESICPEVWARQNTDGTQGWINR